MRSIIPHRPPTIVCAAVDGGRATIAATFHAGRGHGFLPTDPKPNLITLRTKPPADIFGVFVGRSSWVVTARKQLKNEKRARKAHGILFRNYSGRAIQDDEFDVEKVAKTEFSEEELDVFLTNLAIECESDLEKYEIVRKEFYKVIVQMTHDDTDDELGDATQTDRVDKLAEIAAEEELDAFVTNSFTTKLMIECKPKYAKRFREVIEKVRKKMIRDDTILKEFELLTNLMSKCDPDYEKLLCEVLEKVREKITQDDKGENDKINKIGKLAKLDMRAGQNSYFEETLDEFVTKKFLRARDFEKKKPHFMAYEVIEKVAKKVGNENVRKIAENKLDAIVSGSFVFETVDVQAVITYFKLLRLRKIERDNSGRATQDDELDEEKVAKTNIPPLSEEELDVFLTNLVIECETDHKNYEIVRKKVHEVIKKMTQDDELGDATQNDSVDKLAEIAERELDAFVTNSFTTNLMIECEPKYEKRFREIIEKLRQKMIQDDEILEAFELVTNLMSKCEPEYEKLLCQVLEKVREKITQDERDEKGGNENIRKIEKLAKLDILAKLDTKAGKICSLEEQLDKFVTETFLSNLMYVEEMKPNFVAYEVIEKVAKKVGNENVRKIAEKKLDALVTDPFVLRTVDVQINIPYFMYWRLLRSGSRTR